MQGTSVHHGQKIRRTRLLELIVVLMLASTFCRAADSPPRNPAWAQLVDKDFNFYRVTPNLYRSGEFSKFKVAELEQLGILTSIDLRGFGSDTEELNGSPIRQIRIRSN